MPRSVIKIQWLSFSKDSNYYIPVNIFRRSFSRIQRFGWNEKWFVNGESYISSDERKSHPSTLISLKIPVRVSNALTSYSVGISTGDPEANRNYRVYDYERSDNAFYDKSLLLTSLCACFFGFLFFGWGWW